MNIFQFAAMEDKTVPAVYSITGGTASNTGSGVVQVGWKFLAAGGIQRDTGSGYAAWNPSTDYVIPNSRTSEIIHFIRATTQSTSGTATRSGTVGSWLELSVNREWRQSQNTGILASWSLLFEIATDSLGANIVASGILNMDTERN